MRRWVLAFLMAVTANWVSLIYAFGPVSWLLTTILLLGEFLYFNLRPIEKSGAPTKRIWYLKSGCELLRLFLITATVTVFVQMVWLWCQISMITPENSLAAGTAVAGAAFGVLWAVLLEAIVFWNGMIRVYLTSVQLGLKHRVLAALCGWIPILNIWYLRKIIRITADEAVRTMDQILGLTQIFNGGKPIFVDQFLFMDNTPGFEKNGRLIESEIPAFIVNSSDVLRRRSKGYGIWTYRDYCDSVVYNAQFGLDEKGDRKSVV